MTGIIRTIFVCLSVRLVTAPHVTDSRDAFDNGKGFERSSRKAASANNGKEALSSKNNWGLTEELIEWTESDSGMSSTKMPEEITTTNPYYEEVDINRNGLLKNIGSINVGYGVGVSVPGNDPVRVGARVGVGFGASGLAGQLPIGQNIYFRQGEGQSLNDYDGNKANIVADRAKKFWEAVRRGRVKIPHYRPPPSLVGVKGSIDVG